MRILRNRRRCCLASRLLRGGLLLQQLLRVEVRARAEDFLEVSEVLGDLWWGCWVWMGLVCRSGVGG